MWVIIQRCFMVGQPAAVSIADNLAELWGFYLSLNCLGDDARGTHMRGLVATSQHSAVANDVQENRLCWSFVFERHRTPTKLEFAKRNSLLGLSATI